MTRTRQVHGPIVSLLLSIFFVTSYTVTSQVAPVQEHFEVPSPQEVRQVEKAADRFVKRFHKTLDFNIVFEEMFVSDAVQRHRSAGFFQGVNLHEQLVNSVDNTVLERTYKAIMSYYYLKAAYEGGVSKKTQPSAVITAINASKFENLVSDEGTGDEPIVHTPQELDEFIRDYNKIAKLYRDHLPSNVFESVTYKRSLKSISKDKRSPVRIRDGYEDFSAKKGTKVYRIEQDIFAFFFVKENGELKVLTLGMGN